MESFPYILKLHKIRSGLVVDKTRPEPSWVRITTITMCSKFLKEVDLAKFKENFAKLGSITIRQKGSRFRGFEWKMKDTAFYNQVTIGYQDAYSNKSIKIFPNGSIQVAGCSDLFDCRRILRQLSFILKEVLGDEANVPVDEVSVKMINTNFSLNASVNLNKVIGAFGVSIEDAQKNYLMTEINHIRFNGNFLEEYDEFQLQRLRGERIKDAHIYEEYEALWEEVRGLKEGRSDGKFLVTFDPDRYSAVKVKFMPAPGMKQVTASIFSTGRIIVTGAQTLDEIAESYKIINETITRECIVKPVDDPESFATVMGATFEEWAKVLKNKNVV